MSSGSWGRGEGRCVFPGGSAGVHRQGGDRDLGLSCPASDSVSLALLCFG